MSFDSESEKNKKAQERLKQERAEKNAALTRSLKATSRRGAFSNVIRMPKPKSVSYNKKTNVNVQDFIYGSIFNTIYVDFQKYANRDVIFEDVLEPFELEPLN